MWIHPYIDTYPHFKCTEILLSYIRLTEIRFQYLALAKNPTAETLKMWIPVY